MHKFERIYLIVSLLITATFILVGLYQDVTDRIFRKKPRDDKFGYNYQSQLSWIIVAATLPLFNILAILFLLFSWWFELVEGIKRRKEDKASLPRKRKA
jgi:hypothetical protein